MPRFDAQVKTALNLISKNGQPVVWKSILDSTDINSPWLDSGVQYEEHNVEMCFLPASQQTITFMKNTDIPIGAVVGLMGNVPFIPSLKDVINRDDITYRILNIDVLSPNGQKILYTVTLLQ